MHTPALDDIDRLSHGGTPDPQLLDFSLPSNPTIPPGVAGIFESTLQAARRYPPADFTAFRSAAADVVGVGPDQVIPAPGPEVSLRLVFGALLEPGDRALIPAPSCAEFGKEARLQGADTDSLPHDEVTDEDPTAYDVIVLCNPNNPTGDAYPVDELRSLAERCRAAGTHLVINEEFLPYADQSTFAGVPGVVVIRSPTVSSGLPGIRAGYIVADGTTRDRVEASTLPWGLSTPAAEIGTYCLRQTEWREKTTARVARERERIADRLAERFEVSPSDAPFLLFDVGDEAVADVMDEARAGGAVVRDARDFPRIDNNVRVTVRRSEENEQLLEAFGL